jgi:hypothetical protein
MKAIQWTGDNISDVLGVVGHRFMGYSEYDSLILYRRSGHEQLHLNEWIILDDGDGDIYVYLPTFSRRVGRDGYA